MTLGAFRPAVDAGLPMQPGPPLDAARTLATRARAHAHYLRAYAFLQPGPAHPMAVLVRSHDARALSPDQVAQMEVLLAKGRSKQSVAREVGCHYTTVRRYAQSAPREGLHAT